MKTNLKQGRRLAVASLGLSLLAAGIAVPGAYAEEAPAVPSPAPSAPAAAEQPKEAKNVITDEFLKTCINAQLSTPEAQRKADQAVTAEDLKGITALACGADGTKESLKNAVQIKSLAGLEKAVELASLDLSKTQVADLSPLKDLKKLTNLSLSCYFNGDRSSITQVPGYKSIRTPYAEQCEVIKELIPEPIAKFSDISKYPFKAEIEWFAQQRITTGYADGTFRPHENLSRAAMAAFLYRLEGSPEYTAPIESRFKDIDQATPFYKEISWLADQKITTGYGDQTFRPWESISREAMAAFLHRYDDRNAKLGKPSISVADYNVVKFSDTKNSIFKNDIQWLANAGITKGYADGTFRPYEPIERGAIATYFYRMSTLK